MKLFKTIVPAALVALVMASCTTRTVKTVEGVSKGAVDSASVAAGVYFGNMLKYTNMDNLDIEKIKATIEAVFKGDTNLIFNEQSAPMFLGNFQQKMLEAVGKVKKVEEDKFLAENLKNEGVQQSESRLQYKIEVPGNDVKPTPQDTVEVNYLGTLLDGTKFDSSYDRGETITFPVSNVIEGWREGVQLIGEGGKVKLWIPFDLAYGAQNNGPNMPPYSTLVFDLELIKVKKYQPKEEVKK